MSLKWLAASIAAGAFLLAGTGRAARPAQRFVRPQHIKQLPYQKAYEAGLTYKEARQWTDAEDAMRNAAQQHPEEGTITRENGTVIPFVPHYWRAVALYNLVWGSFCPPEACTDDPQGAKAKAALGRYDGNGLQDAIREFDESVRYGAIRAIPDEYQRLLVLRARADHIIQRARRAAELARTVGSQEEKPLGAFAAFFGYFGEPLESSLSKHREQIDAVQARIKGIRNAFSSAPDMERVNTLVPRQAIASDVDNDPDVALDRKTRFARILSGVLAGLKDVDASSQARDLAVWASEAEAVAEKPAAPALLKVGQEFDARVANARRLLAKQEPKMPPPALVEAGALFFAGDYRSAADLLDRSSFSDRRAVVQSLLLSAASRHEQYRATGEADQALLERAAEDVRKCRGLEATVEPSEDFSPSFREFFRKNG